MASYDSEVVCHADQGRLLSTSHSVEDSEVDADVTQSVDSISSSPPVSGATAHLTGGESISRNYSKSPSYLPLAVLALVLSPPFGLAALVLSCLALRANRRSADLDLARSRAQLSLWLSILGLAVSLVAVVFVLVYVFVITPNIVLSFDFLRGLHGPGGINPALLANLSLPYENWNETQALQTAMAKGHLP